MAAVGDVAGMLHWYQEGVQGDVNGVAVDGPQILSVARELQALRVHGIHYPAQVVRVDVSEGFYMIPEVPQPHPSVRGHRQVPTVAQGPHKAMGNGIVRILKKENVSMDISTKKKLKIARRLLTDFRRSQWEQRHNMYIVNQYS